MPSLRLHEDTRQKTTTAKTRRIDTNLNHAVQLVRARVLLDELACAGDRGEGVEGGETDGLEGALVRLVHDGGGESGKMLAGRNCAFVIMLLL